MGLVVMAYVLNDLLATGGSIVPELWILCLLPSSLLVFLFLSLRCENCGWGVVWRVVKTERLGTFHRAIVAAKHCPACKAPER